MAATLNHIMNIGSESLGNSRVGVDVTGHNIANAHTPGYSRQRVNLEARQPIQYGLHVLGQGAKIQNIERVHDKFLEAQLRKEIQTQGSADASASGLAKLETLFSPELQSTVRDRLNSFFNSMREVANMPDEPATRINLVETANALAQSINSAHSGVDTIQKDITAEVGANVEIVNQKLSQVASLNQSIKEMSMDEISKANDLEDRRDKTVREISQLIDCNVYRDENDEVTIRGPGSTLLVEGVNAAHFVMDQDATVSIHPRLILKDFSNNSERDVTNLVETGKIAGLLRVRDRNAQEVRESLNEFAQGVSSSVNEIHRKGFGTGDYAGMNGRDFFEGAEGEDDGEPARNFAVSTLILRDPTAIATGMTTYTPGDNVIANNIVRLFYEPMFDNGKATMSGLYDKFVGKVGIDSMHAKEGLNASNIVLSQIESQKETMSGVSLDEEAAQLLKYQHLFTASSRIITTADEMFKTVLDLKR